MSVFLRLPVPPSINQAYANRRGKGRGRYKTKVALDWEKWADSHLTMQTGPVIMTGNLALEIKLPKIRGDASNRIKVLEDWLVSRGITGDDRFNKKVSVEIDESLDCCEVRISKI